MSKRGSGSICLLCKYGFQPSAVSQKRTSVTRKLSTTHLRSNPNDQDEPKKKLPPWQLAFTHAELLQQLELSSAADVLRRVMLGPRTTNRSRSINQRISNELARTRFPGGARQKEHAYERIKSSDEEGGISVEAATELVRFQIKACANQAEIVRVIAVALGRPDDKAAAKRAKLIANPSLHDTIKRKISMWNSRGDHRGTMGLVGLLISRLQAHGHDVSLGLLYEALKAAAATHSLTALRRYFQIWQDRNEARGNMLQSGPFLNLIILLRKGFEIDSPSTTEKTRQGVLKFIIGSADAMSAKYNLSNHLTRTDFALPGPWLALLADCRAGERIWNEWELAKSGERWRYERKDPTGNVRFEKHRAGLFILALFRAGYPNLAWQVFSDIDQILDPELSPGKATNHPNVSGLHKSVWDALLIHAKSKPTLGKHCQQALDQTLLYRLEDLLTDIEKRLRVSWHKPSGANDGFHTVRSSEIEHLEKLDDHRAMTDFDGLVKRKFGLQESPPSPDLLGIAVLKAEQASHDQDVLETLVSATARNASHASSDADSGSNNAAGHHDVDGAASSSLEGKE